MEAKLILLGENDLESLDSKIEKAVERAFEKHFTNKAEPKQIRGIHGLAKFLNVSPVTAQAIKNSGKVSYSQFGRVLIFDAGKVLEELEMPAKKRV